MTVSKVMRGLLSRDWMEAQGIPFWHQWEWKSPDLFRPFPSRCTLCGKWWRPDMEHFVSLWGRIYAVHREARMPYDEFEKIERPSPYNKPITFVWHNPDIGDRLTGDLGDHLRHICHDHGGKDGRMVTDCQTGCEVWLPPDLPVWRKRLRDAVRDIRYWTGVVAKFAWMIFVYLTHPVRTYKNLRFLAGVGL